MLIISKCQFINKKPCLTTKSTQPSQIAHSQFGRHRHQVELLDILFGDQRVNVAKQEELGFKSDSFEKHGFHEENIDLNMFEDYDEDKSDDDDMKDDYDPDAQFKGIELNSKLTKFASPRNRR